MSKPDFENMLDDCRDENGHEITREAAVNAMKVAYAAGMAAAISLSVDTVRQAMQEAWNDWCADTNSYPDCFTVTRGSRLSFDAERCRNFLSSVTMEINVLHKRAVADAHAS